MKRIVAITYLTAAFIAGGNGAQPAQNQELTPLIKEIQDQQIAIAQNQAKIDEKLVTVAEAVRVARIYASRGGR
ncbi:MAG: hypothetical protein ACR2HH_14700 [Chthoniobacterales bacterium]